MKKIFFANPKANYLKSKKIINNKIYQCLNSNNYILGKNVNEFEKKFSKLIGTKYCISVKNGTDAITIALQSLDLPKNSKILVPSLTATASAMAIVNAGHKPIFCDISERYYTSNVENIKSKFNKNIKAILVVHLHGQAADIDKIKNFCNINKIFLIEDCAQSTGSYFNKKSLGSFGDISTHSFFPTKNLSAIGDGGAICTNNVKLFNKIKKIRQYGWDKNRISMLQGSNSRLDELQAGILNVKINKLAKDIKKRRKISEIYKKFLDPKKFILPSERENSYHSYHIYSVQCYSRNKLKRLLEKKGYFCGIHYSNPLHKMPYFKKPSEKLEITEKISKSFLSLPMYPELKKKELLKFINIINKI